MGTWSNGSGATAGADIFTGNSNAENADGLAGNDELNGGGGNDTLQGGAGDDVLDGGVGNDTLRDSSGAVATIRGGAGDDGISLGNGVWSGVIDGGDGTDRILAPAHLGALSFVNMEILYTGEYRTVTGTVEQFEAFEIIRAVPDSQITYGAQLALSAPGVLDLSDETATLASFEIDGSAGADTLILGDRNLITSLLYPGASARGGGGDDIITAGKGGDSLKGEDGADQLSGGEGDDFLAGGAGADVLNGGEGQDTADYSYAGDQAVIVNLADPTQNAGDAVGDTFVSIEAIRGSSGDDVLIGDENDNILSGGYTGDDHLIGGAGNDMLVVYRNNEGGHDILDGGDGVDWATVYYGHNGVTFISIENYTGWLGDDVITGDAGDNIIRGSNGNDILDGGGGTDFLEGGEGSDIMYVDSAGDSATEASNDGAYNYDTVIASRSWAVSSNIEKVVLTGTGDFNVAGNGLANELRGNSGDNWINGSFGKDVLIGGGGRDSFIFNRALGPTNTDLIRDYDVIRDVIRIDNAVFTGIGAAGALAAGMFNTGAAATQADDRIIYDQTTGRLFFDIDGVGGASQILFATLSTKPVGMSAGEFIII